MMNLTDMPIAQLLQALREKKVKLWIKDGGLHYKAPAGALDKEIMAHISGIKNDIIEYLQGGDSQVFYTQPIEIAPVQEYYPLSATQKSMYFIHKFNPESVSYNLNQALMIEGDIDSSKLYRVFKRIAMRHEMLRTSFHIVNGVPVQKIHDTVHFSMDYSEASEGEFSLQEEMCAFIRPFDLSKPPLFRLKLIKVWGDKGSYHSYLLQDMHHMISDGISENLLVQEINKIFLNENPDELNIQYKDYVHWQNALLASERIQEHKQYWAESLRGNLPVLGLVTDYPRPRQFTYKGGYTSIRVNPTLLEGLERLACDLRVTLFTVLIAAYYILLYKYTGQDDIIIGAVTAGRSHADLSMLIGAFVSMLPLRNHPAADKRIKDFVKEVGNNVLQAFEHQDYPFNRIVEDLNVGRDMGRNPLFDAMFIHQSMGIEPVEIPGYKISKCELENNIAQCDLSLVTTEREKGLLVEINYCIDLFSNETMDRLAAHYINILQDMTVSSEQCLEAIDMISDEEREQLLHKFNNTFVEYEKEKCVHELFEMQTEKNPNAIAVIFEGNSVTYRELNEKANQLARKLVEAGVQPDTIVGILVDRSVEMLIAIMAVLKSGGAYLPLDPEFPAKRVTYMLENSGASFLLSQKEILDTMKYDGVGFDIFDPAVYQGDRSNIGRTSSSNHLAYVLYTSGSTGNPKGVMIEHGAVVNFCKAMTDRIPFSKHRSILALTTISFDIFVLETLLPLTRGIKIILANNRQQKIPTDQSDLIRETFVEMMQATPSRMQMLLARPETSACIRNLKIIMIGGEPFPQELLDELHKLTKAKIFNMYGPTETTVWSAVKDLTRTDHITIGSPVANTYFHVVNKNNTLQAAGIPGELCIAGNGVARGYLNRPDLTSERFVSNPFGTGNVMYKTGDLVKWLANGELEFLGRMDYQVKIRGYRIELSEVESELRKYNSVSEAVVVDKENADGIKYLCAYITANETINSTDVKTFLSKSLPDYMIPSFIIVLEKIPLTPNGKVDRKSLPEPIEAIGTDAADELLSSDTEKLVADVWKTTLGIDTVRVNDSFFDLGGNSLLAVKMQVNLEKSGIYVEIADIIKHHTIKSLSMIIDGIHDNHDKQITAASDNDSQEGISEEVQTFEYGDGQEELHGIEPFNELFHINCFYNAAFPVAKYFGKNILPFLVNDILIYDYEPQNVLSFKTIYFSVYKISEIMHSIGLDYLSIYKSDDLVGDLIDSISKGMPAIIYIDLYFESIRSDMYLKKHAQHTVVVYGFDKVNKVFHIIEQHHLENLDYDKRKIGFEDLKKAYNGYLTYYPPEEGDDSIYVVYKEDKEPYENIVETCRKYFKIHMIEKKTEIYCGVEKIKDFIKDFEKLIRNEDWFLHNGEEMIVLFNAFINGKKSEIYRFTQLFENETELKKLLDKSLKLWTSVRNNVAKSVYSQTYNAKVNIAIECLNEIYCNEIRYNNGLYEILERSTYA